MYMHKFKDVSSQVASQMQDISVATCPSVRLNNERAVVTRRKLSFLVLIPFAVTSIVY